MNKKYLDFPTNSIAQGFRIMPQDFKDCFWSDLELKAKYLIKQTLEECLNYEVDKFRRSKIRKKYIKIWFQKWL